MRILHTSDWHLNDQLGTQPRQGDIVARLQEIAGYLDEYKIDVMVVAGDLFSERYQEIEEWQQAIKDVNKVFRRFLLNGGTILAISGNHDNEAFFNLLRFSLDLAYPIDTNQSELRPPGRLYLATRPSTFLLQDKQGQQIQFVVMPYPTVARYLKDETAHYSSLDEKNLSLYRAMTRELERLSKKLNPRLRSVLVSHAHIRGSHIHSLYRITEQEDVIFNPSDIPTHWDYAAFGHIHKAQTLSGTTHVRYSGSIERLDHGEKDDDKGVVLVEIGTEGRTGDPIPLPLKATPIYRIEILNPEVDIPRFRDRSLYPEAHRALVDYRLVYKPGEHNRDAICKEIESIFPRWYRRKIIAESSSISLTNPAALTEIEDVPGTIRKYLQDKLANNLDRDAVLALYEQLLTEEPA